MTKAQELWKKYLGVDNEMDCLTKKMARTQKERVAVWNALCDEYYGKTSLELDDIWQKQFKRITDNYYKNTELFPDAFELSSGSGGKKKWSARSSSKRVYFANKMRGTDNFGRKAVKVSGNVLISRFEEFAGEIMARHDKFSPNEMKKILRINSRVVDIFYKHHKAEIKDGK